MRRPPGQAGRWLGRFVGAIFALLLLSGLGLGALSWRMAQGPLEAPFLARQIEAVSNQGDGQTRLEIGSAAVAWQGWRAGHLSPFEILLTDVRATDASGTVQAMLPDAAVSLSLPWLLRGQLAPRAIEVRQPFLRVFRTGDGTISLDLGSPDESTDSLEAPEARPSGPEDPVMSRLLTRLMQPPSEETPLSALRRIRVQGGTLQVVDLQIGRAWSLGGLELDLRRREGGGLEGEGQARATLGGESVSVRLAGTASGAPMHIEASLSLPAVQPAALARELPALAPLAALNSLVSLQASATFDAGGVPGLVRASLRAAPGALDLGRGRRIAFSALEARARAADNVLHLDHATLRLAPPPATTGQPGPAPTLTAQAEARLASGRWRATGTLALDRVRVEHLDHHWPSGLEPGARRWIVANLTEGAIHSGEWRVDAEIPESLDDVDVTSLSGRAEVEGATVHWLRPVPPVEGAAGVANFSLDEIAIQLSAGRQATTEVGVKDGTIRFDLRSRPETAEMRLRLGGPIADVLQVLRHPRLKLFEKRSVPLPDVTGMVQDAELNIGLPLIDDLPTEAVSIHATGRATDVRVPDVVLDQDLTRGRLEFTATNDGLRISGPAQLGGIASQVGVEMDFRSGAPSQTVLRANLTGRPEAQQLAAFGLEAGDVMRGPLGLEARAERWRNGQMRVTLRADLRPTQLGFEPLGWTKPRGTAASAEGVLRLQGNTLQSIEAVRLDAPDAALRLRATSVRAGMPERIEIQDSQLGGSRFSGTVRPPGGGSGQWIVALRGPVLDLRAVMAGTEAAPASSARRSARATGPAIGLEANFERVVLGEGRDLRAVAGWGGVDAHAVLLEARAAGQAGSGTFEFTLAQRGTRRLLRLTSEDAGALLRAFGIVRTIEGGQLTVNGTFEETRPGAVLRGTAEMTDFVVHEAPAIGKLLQALTVYGALEAMRGPGLGFARLVAPFQLSPDALVLEEARAFSASLGLTAKGRLDRRREVIDMQGTIVPAYVFNSLLGHIPLLGRLFSPEQGGGLFAATYRVQGPLSDPQVSVNPLAALTPGFLRGLFGPLEQAAPQAEQQR